MRDFNLHTNSNDTEQGFDSLKSWVDFYSKKSGINFVIDESLEAPAAVPDNSINSDLTIILNPKLLKQKFKLSNEELLFVLFHEVEHLIEDSKLKSTNKGQAVARERKKRLEDAKHLAKALHTLENILRDVYVNNEVSRKAPALGQAKRSNYRDHFFKESDFLNMPEIGKDGKETGKTFPLPKHLQFAYTILREAMLPDERCNIDPEIRKIVDRFKRAGVISKASSGDLSDRLESIWKYLEPTYKKLLEEDIKDNQANNKDNKGNSSNSNNGDSSNSKGNPNEGKGGDQNKSDSSNQSESEGNSKEGVMDKVKKAIKKLTGNKANNDNKDGSNSEQSDEKQNNNQEKNEPKNPFDDIYDDMGELPHILDDNLSEKDMEKVKGKIKQKIDKSKPKSKEQLELEKRAENMGIDPDNDKEIENTVKKLRDYDRFLERLKGLKDPEVGNSVMEEIYNLFQNIRAKRLKPKMKSRGPVDMEHGVRLDTGSIATGIAQVKSGETNPVMFKEDVKYVKENLLVGDFDLTIIADGSGSMGQNGGEKNREQKIATLLIFEALKLLHDKLEMERLRLVKPVNFSTEGIMFTGKSTKNFKKSSTDFTDRDRLEAYSLLDYCDGDATNDYDSLDGIIRELNNKPNEYLKSIKSGKTKKIVLVLSDGGSSNDKVMKEKISILRSYGVLIYGVGVTKSGSPVVSLFEGEDKSLGFGQVCEKSEDLAKTLKGLLVEHIKDI